MIRKLTVNPSAERPRAPKFRGARRTTTEDLPPGWRFGTPDYTTDWRLRHAC